MKILVIGRDAAWNRSVVSLLRSDRWSGRTVIAADSYAQGAALWQDEPFDLVLLHLKTSSARGLEFIKSQRIKGYATAVIALSDDHGHETVARALNYGADDVVRMPVHQDELIARIHAVSRRDRTTVASSVQTGPMVVHFDRKLVVVDGRPVDLREIEYQLLHFLSFRKGQLVTKTMIEHHLDPKGIKFGLGGIDSLVHLVRKKLAAVSGGAYIIEVVYGRGYRLSDEAFEVSPERVN